MAAKRKVARTKKENTTYTDNNIDFEQLTFEDILKTSDNNELTDTVKLIVNEEIVEKQEIKEVYKVSTNKSIDIVQEAVKKRADEVVNNTVNNNKIAEVNKPLVLEANIPSENGFMDAYNKKQQKEKEQIEKDRMYKTFPYKASGNILTSAEAQLFHFMKNFIKEDVVIFPKVRLADIIEMDKDAYYTKQDFFKICYKHVDFVLCNAKTFEIICVVELDDYTHDSEEAQQKDMFIRQVLYECNIGLVRIRTQISLISEKDMEGIDFLIKTHFAPKCPLCGSEMEVKASRRTSNYGHRFWSCKQFPTCRGNIDID